MKEEEIIKLAKEKGIISGPPLGYFIEGYNAASEPVKPVEGETETKTKEQIQRLAESSWEKDANTRPDTPCNPHAFTYGYYHGYREAEKQPVKQEGETILPPRMTKEQRDSIASRMGKSESIKQEDEREKPTECFAEQRGDGEYCIFPACHCVLKQKDEIITHNIKLFGKDMILKERVLPEAKDVTPIDKLIQWMDLNYGHVGHSEVQAKAIELSLDETLNQKEINERKAYNNYVNEWEHQDKWKTIEETRIPPEDLHLTEVLFESGEIRDYLQPDWPFALATHWRYKKQPNLTFEQYLKLLGIDNNHAEGVTIWDTLKHNGYKIVKYK